MSRFRTHIFTLNFYFKKFFVQEPSCRFYRFVCINSKLQGFAQKRPPPKVEEWLFCCKQLLTLGLPRGALWELGSISGYLGEGVCRMWSISWRVFIFHNKNLLVKLAQECILLVSMDICHSWRGFIVHNKNLRVNLTFKSHITNFKIPKILINSWFRYQFLAPFPFEFMKSEMTVTRVT